MEDRFFLLIIAIGIAYAIGCWGRTRKIGFGWAFGISLVNAIIGIIVVACSKKLTNDEKSERK